MRKNLRAGAVEPDTAVEKEATKKEKEDRMVWADWGNGIKSFLFLKRWSYCSFLQVWLRKVFAGLAFETNYLIQFEDDRGAMEYQEEEWI